MTDLFRYFAKTFDGLIDGVYLPASVTATILAWIGLGSLTLGPIGFGLSILTIVFFVTGSIIYKNHSERKAQDALNEAAYHHSLLKNHYEQTYQNQPDHQVKQEFNEAYKNYDENKRTIKYKPGFSLSWQALRDSFSGFKNPNRFVITTSILISAAFGIVTGNLPLTILAISMGITYAGLLVATRYFDSKRAATTKYLEKNNQFYAAKTGLAGNYQQVIQKLKTPKPKTPVTQPVRHQQVVSRRPRTKSSPAPYTHIPIDIETAIKLSPLYTSPSRRKVISNCKHEVKPNTIQVVNNLAQAC